MLWMVAVGVVALTAGRVASDREKAAPHFMTYEGPFPFRYGLNVAAPWAKGGYVMVNLPEHLELYPGHEGILRHSDTETPRWRISADGRQAELEAESVTLPGVQVKGKGKVVSASRIEFTMEVTNHTARELPGIVPLYCFHYTDLVGFPKWKKENFEYTYVLRQGRLVRLSDIATEEPEAVVKAAYVRGNPQRDSDKFPTEYGGLIADTMDRGLIAVAALDGKRKVLMSWTPGKSILSNASINCVHADPYYGPIAPGASVTRTGVLVFTEEPLEQAVRKLVQEGWGAPPESADTAGKSPDLPAVLTTP